MNSVDRIEDCRQRIHASNIWCQIIQRIVIILSIEGWKIKWDEQTACNCIVIGRNCSNAYPIREANK